jgi:hypothetical protein
MLAPHHLAQLAAGDGARAPRHLSAACPVTMAHNVIDLRLYASVIEYFQNAEAEERAFGVGEIAYWWAIDRMNETEVSYFTHGVARLAGHSKGGGWEERDPLPDIDQMIWTFHRAWVDRYGWTPSWRVDDAP